MFFYERIFEPLGMRDTGFYVPAAKHTRFPACYEGKDGALVLVDDSTDSRWHVPPTFPQVTGGLVATVDDYLAFSQMLLNTGQHGGKRLLSRPSVALMMTNHLTPEQQAQGSLLLDGRGWGFGGAVTIVRDQVFATPGRYGWDGGHGTSWAIDPHEDLTAILMTQVGFPQAMEVYLDFWTLVYAAIAD